METNQDAIPYDEAAKRETATPYKVGASLRENGYLCECGSNRFIRLTLVTGALKELLRISPQGEVVVEPMGTLKRPHTVKCADCGKRHPLKTR